MTNTKNAGLMITLGHNSSALFYDGKNKPIGYEEERLTRIKSDSSFPRNSIDLILDNIDLETLRGGTIFISHWFDHFEESKFPSKYYDKSYVEFLIKEFDLELQLLNKEFTHHDAHAYSAKAFFLDSIQEDKDRNIEDYSNGDFGVLVADGFGNNQEVISLYRLNKNGGLDLINRTSGYTLSLGLFYQFATEYCDMKPMQDEYKFLGYEGSVKKVLSDNTIGSIDGNVDSFLNSYLSEFNSRPNHSKSRVEAISYFDLEVAKNYFFDWFDSVMTETEIESILDEYTPEEFTFIKRCIIGYFIQRSVELILKEYITDRGIKNLIVAGGCFYNVKLNNSILNVIEGELCVMPLAGDQGAAIGMYEKFIGGFRFYDLCYGKRDLVSHENMSPNIFFFDDQMDLQAKAVSLLAGNKIVNVLAHEMEFGPRALCNTSTLALPTKENVEYINTMNNRNTVMPMAPVILDTNLKAVFPKVKDTSRVIGSNRFMVITHEVREEAVRTSEKYLGVVHNFPISDKYSGRPQVVRKSDFTLIGPILETINNLCLINTSFNTHGKPIVFSELDAIDDFVDQCKRDPENRNYLLILTNNKND